MNWKKGHRILAGLGIAGILFGIQAMTSAANTTGIGAVKTEKTGPGASSVQEIVQEETGSEDTAVGRLVIGETAAGETAPAETSSGGTASGTDLQICYDGFLFGQGWAGTKTDNTLMVVPSQTRMTAIKAYLTGIPDGSRIGLRYQVNLSGSGWLDWSYDGAEAGNSAGEMHLEAIRMELTGSGAGSYDVYYKVLQNGAWTDWSSNGTTAGQEAVGLRVDGICAAITRKGAGAPSGSAYAVDPSKPMVALTFDDGPRSAVTSRILDSLKANGGRATFFMVGYNVDANGDVIRRMVEQGCQVANHTHDHKYISKLSADQIVSQVVSVNQKVAAQCGVSPVVMRPPGGLINDNSLAVLESIGMPAIMWSIDTRDWQHRNAQKTIQTVLSQVKDGDIILMHDIYSTTADAAEVLIPALVAQGYQLVTVSELAESRGGLVPGHKYSQFR